MSALVELHGVAKRYARLTAVDGVDLRVDPGERIALVGHNGAGKTTLMKLMLGLLRPSAGTVRVLGVDPAAASAAPNRRAIGFLPENVAFDDALTGRRLLRFYAGLKRFPASECEAQLERVGLHAAADARVRTYSKGMRQRLGLAQALLGAPRLLLLDEPTGGLDPALRQRFYEILDELTRNGSGVLLSSHMLTELEARTDRIVVMGRGRVIAQGSVGRLREQARLPVRFRLTAAGDTARVLERFAGAAELRACGAAQVCFAAPPEEKIAVLRAIAELDAVRDVEVMQPSLEDLYAHFMPDEERPCAP